MKRQHPASLTVAIVLLVLFSLVGLAGPLIPAHTQVPQAVVIASVILGIAGLIAAAGLWMRRRWAYWLAVVVSVVNFLSSAPGIPGSPTLLLHVTSTVSTIAAIVIIVLVLLPTTRRALRPATI